MSYPIQKDAILEALRERAPKAMHVAEVCVALGVPKQERDSVLDVLEELASLGMAKQLPGNRFRMVKPKRRRTAGPRRDVNETSGRITMHVSGFGFVAAEDGGVDVFIPPPHVGGALHGDRVRIRARPSPKGREGEVMEVLQRASRRVGGVLRRAGGNAWIDPDDPRMRGPMPVVGPIPTDARPGLQVVGDLVRYPRFADEVPEVELYDVLGRSGITEVEVRKLELRDNIVEEFPPEVLAEADDIPDRVLPRERKGREDLRDLDLVTIDPPDARDHDDAVYVEKVKDGGYRVVVAIADVAHYVRPDTAIDREAFDRGCSIYLPTRAIPMLPPELSSNLASLVAGKDRLTMAVEIELGPSGGVRGHRFIEGVMRSRAFLTYDGVARALGLSEEPDRQKQAEDRREQLQTLLDLALTLRKRRMRRGSLDFDLPEARVLMDADNVEPVDVYRSKKDPGIRTAYNMIEEMMLLANEVVAADLETRGVPTIFRVHGQPDEEKLLRFVELANALGYDLDPEDALRPRSLAKFLRKVEGSPNAGSLSYLLLRAMKQATYDTTNIGHFGLGAKSYLHFTSPIRRYPDLAVHRVLKAVIHGDEMDHAALRRELRVTAMESSRLERRAMQLERDVVDLYRAVLVRDRVGEEFDATVSGIASHGFYSSFDEPFVDALTPVEALGDWYEMDDLGIRMTGRHTGRSFALGDRVRLRLEEVSVERRELIALPVGGEEEGDGEAKGQAARRRRRPEADGGRTKGSSSRGQRSRQGSRKGSRKQAPKDKKRRQQDERQKRRRKSHEDKREVKKSRRAGKKKRR